VHQGGIVRASGLSIPTYFCGYNAHFNIPFVRMYREWLRRSVPVAATTKFRRIFVGRRDTAKARRVLNQRDVEHLVQEFGFVTVYFEDLSLMEQLSLAMSAEAIVAPHSSGLTHLLFMNENSHVIELFPHKRQQSCDCYETLSLVTPHRYVALESDLPREGDVEVDVERLRATLHSIGNARYNLP
jgi:capsular polysaccharide biosynthesis protein